MRGFAHRSTVEQAFDWIDAAANRLPSELIPLWQAAGRVLAFDVTSDVQVPGFPRSMMDGYAVRAAETQGASAYNRLELTIVGQSLPGHPHGGLVQSGQAVRIMTGAPLPDGCDAVLPAEIAEETGSRLLALDEVPPGKNIGWPGEDIQIGSRVLPTGRVLRPQDLGLLSALGQQTVEVIRQPRVRLVITGNELLPAGSSPSGHQIPDSNGPMLAALVTRDGALPLFGAGLPAPPPSNYLIPDNPTAILAALQSDADIILVSGGSSVGQEDHAPTLLAEHGELAIHGIAMRPSSPTGMGRLANRLVFLLPGNPVSCLCAYDFFAGRAIRLLVGRSPNWPYRRVRLSLARKLVSQVGRVDYARVKVINNQIEPIAISGASILSSTTAADGFVIIPADSEGFASGSEVEVFLYDH
jgi:molybdopterin molybdotransferase